LFFVAPGCMRFAPDCVPCLLNRVLYEVKLVAPEKGKEAMAASLEILAREYPKGRNSAALATEVHARAYKIANSSDPYADLKRRSDAVAEEIFPRAKAFVDSAADKLEAAVLCAIAGNVLDFGIEIGFERPEDLTRRFDSILAEGLGVDDLPRIREHLSRAKRVLYLLDNCGESIFDRLLVREIKAFCPQVTGVYKGQPILTDVTLEDAKRAALDTCFDALISTQMFAVGVDLKRAGKELKDAVNGADFIVAKGMANFESLSDEDVWPIAYLLRAKCEPVAKAIGAKRNDNVARLFD